MAIRPILIWPDPRLSQVSKPIEKIDASVLSLVQDLLDTVSYEENNAAGVAAPQIGVQRRVFVIDYPPNPPYHNGTNGPEVFINPQFVQKEGLIQFDERCLSIPGESGPVPRASHVLVRYLNIQGEVKEMQASHILAVCLQHETDHLDGKLWIDYQSHIRRTMVRKKMLKHYSPIEMVS